METEPPAIFDSAVRSGRGHAWASAAAAGCCAVLALAFAAGCASRSAGPGAAHTFRFPFIHDYSVENSAVFAWSDEWLASDPDAYQQRLAGPLSALAASVYGYRLGMDVETLRDLGFNEGLMLRRYGRDLDYRDAAWGRDQTGFTIAVKRAVVGGALRRAAEGARAAAVRHRAGRSLGRPAPPLRRGAC